MEDVLKVDADAETGVGGDDGYDALRQLVASRPPRAIGNFYQGDVQAWSPATLKFMVEQLYRDRPALDAHTPRTGGADMATLLGGF
jgi:hypothetical protein